LSSGDWRQYASQYGNFDGTSYALDAFYLSRNGDSPNRDVSQRAFTATFKQQPFKEDLLVERVKRVLPLRSKADAPATPRRFDDAIHLLVFDDKPVIVSQIRDGLADTPWKVSSAAIATEALESCSKNRVDLVVVSLSLPNDTASTFCLALREAGGKLACIPAFGLCVKTAVAEQTRAQQVGFANVITKPINIADLKTKITKALRLETSYRYFQTRELALVLTIPGTEPLTIGAIELSLNEQLTTAVDAGLDTLILDLKQVVKADIALIKLVLEATRASTELGLKTAIIGSDEMRRECCGYEETREWKIVASFEEAIKCAAGDLAIA
jgi:DNA-binding response OmpR family regulator